jgi:[acyl-carrier-protein] S-malonyltransferase
MDADGATRFVEIGAGSVLQGLVKRTLGRDAERKGVDTADDCATFLDEIAASA